MPSARAARVRAADAGACSTLWTATAAAQWIDTLGAFTGVPLRGNALFLAMDTPLRPIWISHG